MIPDAKGVTAPDVISELCEQLDRENRLGDRVAFMEAVMAREKMSPTSFPPGWALPHARIGNLSQLSFGLARTPQPFPWLGFPAAHVRLVWLFAVPELATKAYLNLVASIARLSQNASLVEQLIRAQDARNMFAILEQVPLLHTRSPELAADTPSA
jgi:PTS system fructose-specific IIC component